MEPVDWPQDPPCCPLLACSECFHVWFVEVAEPFSARGVSYQHSKASPRQTSQETLQQNVQFWNFRPVLSGLCFLANRESWQFS